MSAGVLERLKLWVAGRLARTVVRAHANPSRRAELREGPLPDGWGVLVAQHLRPFTRLSTAQQARLLDDLKVFAGEKEFVGLDGFTVDERARVLVSASAALMVLGLDISCLDHVTRIEIRASTIDEPSGVRRAGQYRHATLAGVPYGIVELSWDEAVQGLTHDDGYNVVLHELAHAFDHGDGLLDALADHPRYPAWQAALRHLPLGQRVVGDAVHSRLVPDVEGPELFAVATELFFEHPHRLHKLDAELFEAMAALYQLDPRDFA